MSSESRIILCGEATADRISDVEHVLRLRDTEPGRNVHLQVDDIARSLTRDVPPAFDDLIEIATYVYVADQSHTRGGDGVGDMGANWRRPLHFEIPVRALGLWQRQDVALALREVLSFLSEDEYTFVFRKYRKPPGRNYHINFCDIDYPDRPERVVLFSGGLDSLGGAVQEVVLEGRPVALVTHQSSPKFINRLRTLRGMLDQRATGPRPLHVTVEINKQKGLNHEYTQRSRSFLYASLGATIARMLGLDGIRFYENGTVSLNLPISRQVVGSKATRTTHPRVLAGFRKLFSLIADGDFDVTNGFLWKTKGEVVQLIRAAGCGGMVEWSTSCTHTWEITNAKPHCGKCSQCIDRRFAVLAGGAGDLERADSYGVDLLTDPRDAGEPRTMLASYVETAQQVAAMSEAEFFMRFGEVARIVRQLGGSADENARKVYDLYRRHAREVVSVVDGAIGRHASQIRSRALPESCLLRLVHDPSVPEEWGDRSGPVAAPAGVPSVEPDYFLRQRGEAWQLRFAGHEVVLLLPALGFIYLREILKFPHKRFSVSALVVGAYGDKAVLPLGDGGKVLDAQAKKAYAERLIELDEELEEAQQHSDIGRQEKLGSEREALLAQVRIAGLKSRAKRNNADLDRLRKSVGNAIRRALKTIGRYEPQGYDHLKASISFGFSIAYQPAQPVPWSF